MADSGNNRSGWRSWLEQQFVRHAVLVRAVIWNRLGRGRNANLVDELAGETWARAVRGVQSPGFDPARDFAPWVSGIAANVCREHFRRQCRAMDPTGLPQPDDLQAPDDCRQAQELQELHCAVADCLAGLSEVERKVYMLRFEQGLSGRAAAEALGVPESTFREQVLPGMFAKLARCLAGKGFDRVLANGSAQRPGIGQSTRERRSP